MPSQCIVVKQIGRKRRIGKGERELKSVMMTDQEPKDTKYNKPNLFN